MKLIERLTNSRRNAVEELRISNSLEYGEFIGVTQGVLGMHIVLEDARLRYNKGEKEIGDAVLRGYATAISEQFIPGSPSEKRDEFLDEQITSTVNFLRETAIRHTHCLQELRKQRLPISH